LLINDRIDVALAVDADGVHLGQNDMPYHIARQILGPDKIIGWSVESYEQAEEANDFDVDYIAISPVFVTATKRELTNELGIEGVKKISEISRHPAVAIGSIKEHNAAEIVEAGADGIAVVSGICSADQPKEAAENLLREVHKGKNLGE
jgi:thiamine-phosphate pyrophosphorylase